jgi:preprotein translocase subunit SecY
MNWRLILKSLKNKTMRNKVLSVLGMLLVYRIMSQIPIPFANGDTIKQVIDSIFTAQDTTNNLSFFNLLSGGALSNLAIVLVGLTPFINSSIIMQLLTKAIPKLETLSNEGEFGRKKINQFTRMIAFPLAIVQSVGVLYLVKNYVQQYGGKGDIIGNATLSQWVLMVSALTGAAMILMWLGEIITEQGIGNGISLLITVGIVSQLPKTASLLGRYIFDAKGSEYGSRFNKAGVIFAACVAVIGSLLIYLVVKLNEAQRKITINYAKRVQGNRTYGGVTTTLPIKLITAGVVPIIFASAFLTVPSFVGSLIRNSSTPRWSTLGKYLVEYFQIPNAQTLQGPSFTKYVYPIAYFSLVVLFTYFYTSLNFNSKEIAENLQKQGGFIDGVRPGTQTEKYLSSTVNRLLLFGSMALGLLAVFPTLAEIFVIKQFPNFNPSLIQQIGIGGTSILILVSVSLETLRQIESRSLMITYDHYEDPEYLSGK